MKLNLFYLLGKSVTIKTRVLAICGFLLFAIFPIFRFINLYNEYRVSKYYIISEAEVISIRKTFIIFKRASVSFQLNGKKYYKSITYMPLLEDYNNKQVVALKVNPVNCYSTFNKPFFIRSIFDITGLAGSFYIWSLIYIQLKKRETAYKLDGEL